MKQYSTIKSLDNFAGVHYTTKHTGKMSGLVSLSGDINSNPICMGRQKIAGSICAACFAANMFDDARGRYRGVNDAFKRNSEILCSRLLADDEIPRFDPARFPLLRFAAYDDLANVTQALNYIKIARKNPEIKCAVWTKNPGILARAFRVSPKPDNLQVVLSSMGLNRPAAGVRFDFVDKVFTVYDPATIEAERIDINCGARSCFKCRLCYEKNPAGVGLVEVREKLKK